MAVSSSSVRVAVIQTKNSDNISENVERTIAKIREAHAQGAQIVSTQELFPGTYPCQSEDHERFKDAEPIPGPTTNALCKIAKELKLVIVGSLFEKRDAGLYHNTAAIIDADGSMLGMYRKMHIPDDPLYYEKFYFTPGDLGFRAWNTKVGKIGVLVCWDQWFPEGARITAMKGARLLFYPTAIGWHPSEKAEYGKAQHNAWQTMMRSHSIANGVFVAAANRTGVEGNIEFWGASFISDPYGNVVQQAPHEEEAILVADCDFDLVNTARTHWPFLRDRRIDAYDGLLKRYLDQDGQ
jgi:N-carbamoylputrescine amidase